MNRPFIFSVCVLICAAYAFSGFGTASRVTAGTAILPQKTAPTPVSGSVYRSKDGGKTWFSFSTGLPEDAAINGFLETGGHLYIATEAHGVFVNRGGENWEDIGRLLPVGIDVNAIEVSEGLVVIGTSRHGIFSLKTGSPVWQHHAGALDKIPTRGLHAFQGKLFAATDTGIYRSGNRGQSWEPVHAGVQINGFASTGHKIYAAAMNGALLSEDGGSTWQYIYRPLALHDIATDGTRVFAMTLGDGLLASTNDGLFWQHVNTGLGRRYTFEVVSEGDDLFAGQWTAVFHSGNTGVSWEPAGVGLPDSTAFTALANTWSGLLAGRGLR